MEERFIEAVSNILSIAIHDLSVDPASYGIAKTAAWDSLAHLAIMTELEELIGQEISIDEMEELDTLEKILARVTSV